MYRETHEKTDVSPRKRNSADETNRPMLARTSAPAEPEKTDSNT
jgi:hypothetical protein